MPLPLLLLWTDGVVLLPAAVESLFSRSVAFKAAAPIIAVLLSAIDGAVVTAAASPRLGNTVRIKANAISTPPIVLTYEISLHSLRWPCLL